MSLFVLGPRLGVEKNGVFGKLAQLVVSISNSLFQLGLRVISAVGFGKLLRKKNTSFHLGINYRARETLQMILRNIALHFTTPQ
ncbi:hypothetical protein WG66_002496 [Moniliophthora roreri]|nr:hypothetical protein WG66_002496 [Moniliophthora roreri]